MLPDPDRFISDDPFRPDLKHLLVYRQIDPADGFPDVGRFLKLQQVDGAEPVTTMNRVCGNGVVH